MIASFVVLHQSICLAYFVDASKWDPSIARLACMLLKHLYNIIRRIASHWMRLLPKYHQQRHSYFWMPFEISHPLNKGPLQWTLRLSSVIHTHAPMVMCLSGGRQVLSNMSYHYGCLFRLMQLTSRCVLILPTKGLGVGINYLDNVRILT